MTDYVTVTSDAPEGRTGAIKLHGRAAFDGMHRAGRLCAETLDMLVPHMVPGVTTAEIDRLIYDFITAAGGVPATLGYRGYTHSSCISLNHVVCHGIPSEKTLKSGDIVNVDVTPILDGWHGDSSRMYLIGDVPLKARRLV
ncbi:MAG TPA: M24 family metallopeptidase, partial [Sphingomonas sp.]